MFILQTTQTGLSQKYLRGLRLLFPKMRLLTIEIEDVWFWHKFDRKERWINGINDICKVVEDFLRTDDTLEQIRLVVLDKPGVAVKRFNGFHRKADKFVKEVRCGASTFSASIQASSQDVFGRRFY